MKRRHWASILASLAALVASTNSTTYTKFDTTDAEVLRRDLLSELHTGTPNANKYPDGPFDFAFSRYTGMNNQAGTFKVQFRFIVFKVNINDKNS